MNVMALLEELRSRDIQVWPDADQLRCNAPAGALTPELREALRQRKADILEFLRSVEALAHQQRAIVPLQSRGERVPIFAVAGHNGDVFCYRALVRHLGDDQPFFGLQPPGLDGQSEPVARVEDLAAYFAAEIQAFRPNGPYVIAGYCAGSTIAFELARQLLQDGATINFVALFGGPYSTWFRVLPQLRQRLTDKMERVSTHAHTLASLPDRERRLYVAEILRRHASSRATGDLVAPDPVVVLRSKVEAVTLAGVRRYRPHYFAGRVSLFFPNKQWLHSVQAQWRWRSVARESDEYCGPADCEAGHMLLEPCVARIAELFRRCREKSRMELAS